MTDHVDEDRLFALALGDLDEHERDDLTLHLGSCHRCRSEYAAVADGIDRVLVAAPRVAPPPGFSRSVLAAMGMAVAGVSPAARRRRGLAVALVATVALLAGAVGAVAVLESRREPAVQVVAADGPALLTRDGARVGTVLSSRFEGTAVLVVTLTDGRAGVRYDCELVLADGTRESAGSWLVEDPAVTWVVARPDDAAGVSAVELVTPSGAVWAKAAL